ncbi:Acetyltransferase (GNAT) family protein [Flagellimonas taeanensis]|jgi:N-acetylglutamate synthase-like GNAT family acetyltransferase|uniref:Acetyltransferase (GNAT) domain-containing protein n=1 Tax=Flagellimonas taeanensis TaxID=1005926 RepID=A0A1M7A0J2_9FLAO|nr:GNAT family N-acetyltransferase [Allomuricauda taeanensis]SFC27044.1 Acetyltransferase (GNAT) family protein [Allomuricauda taeanensis]SHL36298.1 Acetyltransferase (GNAT) domain-containing protein [Allomuricauda taeanensis]
MEFYISEDKQKLDIEKVHKEIKATYWGGYRSQEETIRTIENTICFGLFNSDDEQIGFARLLTDSVVFAYLMDVVIFDPYKGRGLGKMLIKHIMDRPDVQTVKTVALKTKDAHTLYEAFGFERVGNSEMWLAIDRAKYD